MFVELIGLHLPQINIGVFLVNCIALLLLKIYFHFGAFYGISIDAHYRNYALKMEERRL